MISTTAAISIAYSRSPRMKFTRRISPLSWLLAIIRSSRHLEFRDFSLEELRLPDQVFDKSVHFQDRLPIELRHLFYGGRRVHDRLAPLFLLLKVMGDLLDALRHVLGGCADLLGPFRLFLRGGLDLPRGVSNIFRCPGNLLRSVTLLLHRAGDLLDHYVDLFGRFRNLSNRPDLFVGRLFDLPARPR